MHHFIRVMMLTSFSDRQTPACFAFHQRKALQKISHNTLEILIPTLQLDKRVDSNTDSSHRLLTYCLSFGLHPPPVSKTAPRYISGPFYSKTHPKSPHGRSWPIPGFSDASPSALASTRVPLGVSQGRKHQFLVWCCKITAPLFHLQY